MYSTLSINFRVVNITKISLQPLLTLNPEPAFITIFMQGFTETDGFMMALSGMSLMPSFVIIGQEFQNLRLRKP
jgi:hypothetical protein